MSDVYHISTKFTFSTSILRDETAPTKMPFIYDPNRLPPARLSIFAATKRSAAHVFEIANSCNQHQLTS